MSALLRYNVPPLTYAPPPSVVEQLPVMSLPVSNEFKRPYTIAPPPADACVVLHQRAVGQRDLTAAANVQAAAAGAVVVNQIGVVQRDVTAAQQIDARAKRRAPADLQILQRHDAAAASHRWCCCWHAASMREIVPVTMAVQVAL